MLRKFAAWVVLVSLLTACGGGGGGSTPPPAATPTPTPTPAPTVAPSPSPTSTSGTVTIPVGSQAQTLTFSTSTGVTGQIGVPAASGSGGTVTATLEDTLPTNVPALQGLTRGGPRAQIVVRSKKSANASAVLGYFVFTVNPSFTISASPSFTFVLTSTVPTAGDSYYGAFYNGSSWQDTYLTGSATGSTLTFASNPAPISLVAGTTYAFAFYQTKSTASAAPTSSPTPTASPSATPAPESSAQAAAAFTCPSSDSTTEPSFVARGEATRHFVRNRHVASAATSTRLSVVYDARSFRAPAGARAVTTQESALGAGLVAQMSLAKNNRIMRVLTVPAGTAASAATKLRTQAGVISVGLSGQKRHTLTVNPYYPNDPYFTGFTAAQNTAAGNGAPATFELLPFAESASVPGQWDMHAIGLEHAYGYSQTNNGSNVTPNANALGSAAVNVAVIDTGEDANHPELASKIVRQRCFITNEAGTSQSTGNYSLDQDGHGTDVSGIAAADSNNGLGFSGAGGKVSVFAYRVFPTPDDTCGNPDTGDSQCETDTADIASAITDAVNSGANVISMSLGGGGGTGNSGCINGTGGNSQGGDSDATEGIAVEYAISHGVIVVAASGNSATSGEGVAAPACDSGVIAVGATSLDDGTANGAGVTYGGSASAPLEYVASYSQYGSPGTALHSSTAWGIVAPGGDPSSDMDNDDLHWIENIWTTTPFESSASDQTFLGGCTPDYASLTATADCRTLIAGTSMATPHVAGAVALILSVNSSYATPAAMKALLCSTADQLTATGTQNQGCGRLNVYRAMATALGDSALP